MLRSFIIASIALVPAACATVPAADLASQLRGRSVRSVDSAGAVYVHHFSEDGEVHTTAENRPLTGRWTVVARELCFDWPDTPRVPDDCWRFDAPLEQGRAVTARSRDGRTVQATLQ